MAATEHVILVNKNDEPLGQAEKMLAHREGLCHRAFSVFVIKKDPNLALLLQQRAKEKYHSPNLWTNTCCSHPRPGEEVISAAERRLAEEMGLKIPLTTVGRFHYIAKFNNGLTENEVDHVLIGVYDNQPIRPNSEEVQNYRWITLDDLQNELNTDPEKFTPWLKEALEVLCSAPSSSGQFLL